MEWKLKPDKEAELQKRLNDVRARYNKLSPGGQLMLKTIIKTGWDASIGMFFPAPRRVDIAKALKRPGDRLSSHDVELLKRLVAAGLIEQRRHALKLVDHMARGAEYRYHISNDLLFCYKKLWKEWK